MQNQTELTFMTYSETISLVVLCSCLLTVGCIGNVITIAALVRTKSKVLKTSTTALVVNLSLADSSFCMFIMPMRAAMIIGRPTLSCGIFLFFFYGNVTVALMTMVSIAINRFLLVVHKPTYDRIFTKLGTIIIIVCVWLYSYSLWSIPLSGLWGEFDNHVGTPFCRLVEEESSPKMFLGFFGFVLPLSVITTAYIAVFIALFKSTRKHPVNSNSNGCISNRKRQREINVTRVLVVAYCSFLLFFLPNFIILMIPSMRENPVALTAGEILLWLSSCCNPFIYVLCSSSYSKAYRELFAKQQDRSRISFMS